MRQVIKHRDIRLLNMIRRTDPVIHKQSGIAERCEREGEAVAYRKGDQMETMELL